MNLNTWEHKRLIFLFLWNFPTPDAFCGSRPSLKSWALRVQDLDWRGVFGIDQAVSKVCVMTDSGDATAVVVLVVEDETLVRLLANDILTEAGYRVLEARDGQEALMILEVHANVRALFTDVTIPNVDGLSPARLVSERWPEIGIVITSGVPLPSELPSGTRFLPKPASPNAVLRALETVIADTALDT